MDDSLKVEFQENLNQLETGKNESEEQDNFNPNKTNFNKHILFSAIFGFTFLGLVNYI